MPRQPTGGKHGRPAHQPTDETRLRVLRAVALGVTQDGTARLLGVSIETLRKHYKDEIERSGDILVEEIAGAMYGKALSGDTAAQRYILGCRAGWSEKQQIEHTGKIETIERVFVDGKINDTDA
jgi:hypothetical protein